MTAGRVLVIDLNNYARYPTLAIGYLIAPLRMAGFDVKLVSPLAQGQTGIMREREENYVDHMKRMLYFTPPRAVAPLRDRLRNIHESWANRVDVKMRTLVTQALVENPCDVILLSAYLQHWELVEFVGDHALRAGIPVLLGGPAFSDKRVASEWVDIPGINAVFGGEAELVIVDIVHAAINRENLAAWQGAFVRGEGDEKCVGTPAVPLANLDVLPPPDFDDFPWERYPHRIIPVMTGRGCGWGLCMFCSDVITSNGRTFRSRSLDHVLDELERQSEKYQSKDFIFLDIKLNSHLPVWYGLIDNMQRRVPGARWIGTVHVGVPGENGLDRETLKRARESGLTRMSFGLESGSQRMLRRMSKGTRVESNSRFVEDASEAGISVRSTMMVGYPSETTADVLETNNFLAKHRHQIDRIHISRFKPIPGTRFENLYKRRPERFGDIRRLEWDYKFARAEYEIESSTDPAYNSAVRELARMVHLINRSPLKDNAVQFDGLM